MSRFTRLFAVILCAAFSSSPALGLVLTRGGEPSGVIVISPSAAPPERFAAEELRKYIQKISGAEIEIMEEAPRDRRLALIRIGAAENISNFLPAQAARSLERADSPRSFHISTRGNSLFIAGKRPAGALNGVYALLEEHLGVRWFYPGEKGEHVPVNEDIVIGGINEFQSPSIEEVTLNLTTASYEFRDSLLWMARNRMTVSGWKSRAIRVYEDHDVEKGRAFLKAIGAYNTMRGGHSIFEQSVPGQEYFETNPEYFALLDGERTWTPGGRQQRCVSNPEVRGLVENFAAQITEEPGARFSFGAEDNVRTWCQCEECARMGAVDGVFSVTNLFHRYVSEVASNVLKRNPEADLNIDFYTNFRTPPAADDVRYHGKNVTGTYYSHQRCYVHGFNDPGCAENRRQYGEFMEWREKVPAICLYDYMNIANSPYAPLEYVLAEDLKHFAGLGMHGWMDEVPPVNAGFIQRLLDRYPGVERGDDWLSRWQTYYVAAKLGWNSGLDAEEVMEDAYGKYYGPAAAPMRKYHALRRELWDNAPGHAFYGGPRRIGYCLTVPGAEEELRGFLAEAFKLAAGDELVTARIDMDRDFLDRFWKQSAEDLRALFSAEKRIVPQRADSRILVDGNLSEPAWLTARPVDNFISLSSGDAPVEKTSVRVLYDDKNLYFGIVAMAEHTWGDPYQLKADARERNDSVWLDDSVEILIAPPPADNVYYHVMANTEGVVYDARCEGPVFDTSYDSGVEVAVRKLADRQVYEFRIPLGPMGARPAPGQMWGMNFVRNCNSLQPPVTGEASTVDGIRPHRISDFRRVTFGESALENSNFADLVPVREGDTGAAGDRAPNHWGVKSSEFEIIEGPPNTLNIKNGFIFQFVTVPPELRPLEKKLLGELRARGEGEIWVRLSTTVIPPDSGKRFSHENQPELARSRLGEQLSTLSFEYDLEPHEQAYLYVYVRGEALITDVSAVIIGGME